MLFGCIYSNSHKKSTYTYDCDRMCCEKAHQTSYSRYLYNSKAVYFQCMFSTAHLPSTWYFFRTNLISVDVPSELYYYYNMMIYKLGFRELSPPASQPNLLYLNSHQQPLPMHWMVGPQN